MRTVVINEGCLTFDLAVPCEVFGWDRSYLGVDWYDFKVVAADPPPIRTVTGFTIETPHRLDALADADTIVVPGWSDPDVPPAAEPAAALRDAYDRGARLVSICIGAFVLAEAGLLDGRSATTHWVYADRFRVRFPRVRLEPKVLYVDDGPILTSAGTAAGMDPCLHLVLLDHGAQVANGVADGRDAAHRDVGRPSTSTSRSPPPAGEASPTRPSGGHSPTWTSPSASTGSPNTR